MWLLNEQLQRPLWIWRHLNFFLGKENSLLQTTSYRFTLTPLSWRCPDYRNLSYISSSVWRFFPVFLSVPPTSVILLWTFLWCQIITDQRRHVPHHNHLNLVEWFCFLQRTQDTLRAGNWDNPSEVPIDFAEFWLSFEVWWANLSSLLSLNIIAEEPFFPI